MLKIRIAPLSIRLKWWLPVVWFWVEEYNWQDFFTFVEYVKKLRKAQPSIIYDFNLRKNITETTDVNWMVNWLKKLFESKSEEYDSLEVIATIEEEKDYDSIENVVDLDISSLKEDFSSLYWPFINWDKYQLRRHQLEAIEFFRQKKRVYLAYEPWTWKSLTYYWASIFDNYYNWTKNILVVSPAKYNAHVNLHQEFLSYQWDRELNICFILWSPKHREKLFKEFEENMNRPWPNIMLISYETLRLEPTLDKVRSYWFDLIICDEAKALINWNSKQSAAIRKLVEENPNSWLIMWEWTPMRWFADDLWNPLDLLQPGKWWSYYQFRSEYCYTKTVTFWKNSSIIVTWVKNTWKLHKRVWQIMLTKKLNELKDIPPVQFTKISVWLTKPHSKLLERISDDFINWYREFKNSKRAWTMLEKDEEQMKRMQVLRLYQASTVPSAIDKSFDESNIEWLKVLSEYVEDVILWRWKKVVIFTHFRESAFMIERAIKRLKIFKKEKYSLVNYLWKNKLEMKTKFQEDNDCKVFISTTASWWEAITLTAADSVIFYELPLTWSETFQAIRRVQRIWQEAKKINVVSIIPEWTILEWIEKRIEKKKISLEKIIDWKEDFIDRWFSNWYDDILWWFNEWQ